MPILLKRRDGSTTPFRNAQFLPAFYFIPQSILEKCGPELCSIPRNPKKLIQDPDAVATVESDLFMLCIIDAYAYMVWPFMGKSEYMEVYSGYDPAWLLAHSPTFWIQELQDEKNLPSAEALIQNCTEEDVFGFVSETEISELFGWIVPQAMEKHHMNEALAVTDEMRCFEDFDKRNSTQKIDFYRKWYHTRSKSRLYSLEGAQKDYARAHNGQQWDAPDDKQDLEQSSLSQVMVDAFLETLTEKDKEILRLRMEGVTLEEIAQQLGYKTHSAVLKRIRKIGQAYEAFADVDYGFSKKKITG